MKHLSSKINRKDFINLDDAAQIYKVSQTIEALKVGWNPFLKKCIIRAMHEVQAETGGSTNKGFKSKEWTRIHELFLEYSNGVNFTMLCDTTL